VTGFRLAELSGDKRAERITETWRLVAMKKLVDLSKPRPLVPPSHCGFVRLYAI
jgi:hypothetical protein